MAETPDSARPGRFPGRAEPAGPEQANPAQVGPAQASAAPLYGPEFERDPGAVYERLWQTHGAFAPVLLEPGVPAWLALTYDAVASVSRNPALWSHDARRWADWSAGRVPANSALLPVMTYRANLLFADGQEHVRLRRAVVDSLGRIEAQWLELEIHRLSGRLIDAFCERGEADLVGQYARLLPPLVFNRLFGLDADAGSRLLDVLRRIAAGPDADRAGTELARYFSDLVAAKRGAPGADVTTWLMEHRAELTDAELAHQLMLIMAAGNAPTADLISATLHSVLAEREAGTARRGVEETIDRVLWTRSPVQNFPFVYPKQDVRVGEATIRRGCPVGLGLAAANQSIVRAYGDRMSATANRGYLSFGVGDHRCPAQDMARQIAVLGVQAAFARLPGLHLTRPGQEPPRRTSVFARALAALPVTFEAQARRRAPVVADPAPADAEEGRSRTGVWRSIGGWLTGH